MVELVLLAADVITDGMRDCRHVVGPGTILGARNRRVVADVASAYPNVVKYEGLGPLAV